MLRRHLQKSQKQIRKLLGVEEALGETDSEIAKGDISGSDEVGRATVIGCNNR